MSSSGSIDINRLVQSGDEESSSSSTGVGVNVDSYGALGDGSTDDSVAIQAAIVAAGDGGMVVFSPDKTYIYGRSLYFYPNQTFSGYGATLKRGDLVSSQLTGPKVGNVYPVTDGSLFAVGMEVAAWGDDDTFTNLYRVTAVAGNNVTLNGSDNAAASGGTPTTNDYLVICPVAFSGSLSGALGPVDGTPDNVKILGLKFDGNLANNGSAQAPLRWELMREISQLGDNCLVQNCTFENIPCEGIVAIGAYSKVTNCHFENVNGNGMHFSGGDHAECSSCTFTNTNIIERGGTIPYGQYVNGVGHQEAACTMSSANSHCIISNIGVDGALSAVGNISSECPFTSVDSVTARNCSLGLLDIASTAVDCSFSNIKGEDCTELNIRGNRHQVSNVTLSDTPLVLSGNNMTVNNAVSRLIGNTTDYCLNVAGDQNIVLGFTGEEGQRGINIAGGAANNIVEGFCKNNNLYGCAIAGNTDTLADANQVTPHIILESGYTESANYDGIDFSGVAIIKGGSAYMAGGSRIIDIRANADNAVIDGFTIILAGNAADLIRLNGQNDVTIKNMTFPNGTTSANAFTVGSSTGFTPINNYAVASSTALTGA